VWVYLAHNADWPLAPFSCLRGSRGSFFVIADDPPCCVSDLTGATAQARIVLLGRQCGDQLCNADLPLVLSTLPEGARVFFCDCRRLYIVCKFHCGPSDPIRQMNSFCHFGPFPCQSTAAGEASHGLHKRACHHCRSQSPCGCTPGLGAEKETDCDEKRLSI